MFLSKSLLAAAVLVGSASAFTGTVCQIWRHGSSAIKKLWEVFNQDTGVSPSFLRLRTCFSHVSPPIPHQFTRLGALFDPYVHPDDAALLHARQVLSIISITLEEDHQPTPGGTISPPV
ncbi:hypothetical protein FB451DRAFT_1433490 [Mycena latifolia]|nr:hypothetical protein FB451DRAFT_1433490 [Mycena latifolia]